MPAIRNAKPPPELWSIRRQFARYLNAKCFYRLHTWRLTQAENETTLTHDPYWCQVIQVKHSDDCVTQAEHDYRLLQPVKITDSNGTVEQALYDAFGRLLATTLQGHESGKTVGFGPLSAYQRPEGLSVDSVIQAPAALLGEVASAWLHDPFSWMGCIDTADRQAAWVNRGYLLPDGYIRATARLRLKKNPALLSMSEKALSDLIANAPREPVHSLRLSADRYNGDGEQLIQMTLTCWDGVGRTLQSKQKTEPGLACAVADSGDLVAKDGAIQQVQADPRWCVNEHNDYSAKGWTIRIYRPYYANAHRYIHGESLRQFWHSDKQFHDALGRPTLTLTARAAMRQTTYWAWYTVSEDENDTQGSSPNTPLTEQ